ncbi:MAG: O-antigen ligase family protein [Bacteroidota bacterium]
MINVSSRREDRQPFPLDIPSRGWAHRGCVIIAIIVLLGFDGILKLLHVRDDDSQVARMLSIIFFTGLFALSYLYWARRISLLRELVSNQKLLVTIVAYCIVSVAWSSMQSTSIVRVMQLVGMTLLSATVVQMQVEDSGFSISALLRSATVVVSVVALFYVLLFPEQSISVDSEDRLQGPYSHPNTLAQMSAFAVAVWLPRLRFAQSPSSRVPALLILGIQVYLISVSGSATGLTSLFFLVLLAIILQLPSGISSGVRKLLIASICVVLPLWYLLTANSPREDIVDPITEELGRDASLTGRLPLWYRLIAGFQEEGRLLFGFGYGGFWAAEEGPAVDMLYGTWTPQQAHNGYLDVLLQIGAVGLMLFLLFLFKVLRDAFRYASRNPGEGLLYLYVVSIVLLQNFSETTFIRTVSLAWLAFVAAAFVVSRNQERGGELTSRSFAGRTRESH